MRSGSQFAARFTTCFAALLALPLLALLLVPANSWAQDQPAQAPAVSAAAPSSPHMDEPESNAQMEAFRHSPAVESIARHLHLSTETTARIIEDINSGILIAAILWFLFRTLPKVFRKRNETLQKELLDARLAATSGQGAPGGC